MLNSVAAGRRQTGRAIAWQGVAVALVALACLWKGGLWSAAAVYGGATVALAGWISARIALAGGVEGAGVAVARLLAGVIAKWAVLLVLLAVGVLALGLHPMPMLLAAVAVLLAQVLALAIGR